MGTGTPQRAQCWGDAQHQPSKLGEEEEGWRRKMEKSSWEGRREEAEEGNKGLRKAPDGGQGTGGMWSWRESSRRPWSLGCILQ